MPDRLKKKSRRQPAVMLIWLAGLFLTASLTTNAEDSPVRSAPLRLRIEWLVQTYGVNHVGLQTMTIRENVTDRKEFERRRLPAQGYIKWLTCLM